MAGKMWHFLESKFSGKNMKKVFNDRKQLNKIVSSVLLKKKSKSAYYKFGISYFGPFLYGYTKWLYSVVKNSGYKKVFFFSRDGYMMEKAFKIFNADNQIKSEYVYFSRKSIRQALLYHCSTYAESLKYLTYERYITLSGLLEYYGFMSDEREQIARKYNLGLNTNFLYSKLADYEILKKIYVSFKHYIDQNSLMQEKLLLGYIKQINMYGKCAIVDIGWHGSMQFYLEEFISMHSVETILDGYYVGINPIFNLKGKAIGYLYDAGKPKLRKSVLCFFGGYEKLFQSCEGSVYGYKNVKNVILPVLGNYEYEGMYEFITYINEWQAGAMFFIKKVKKLDINFEDKMVWAYPLIRMGKNPSCKEVKLFSFFYNIDGAKSYFVSQKPLYKYKLGELIYALSDSPWKTGFMKSLFKLPLPYYWVYSLARK